MSALHLWFKGFSLCDGCSRGNHVKHTPFMCHCDLCIEETP